MKSNVAKSTKVVSLALALALGTPVFADTQVRTEQDKYLVERMADAVLVAAPATLESVTLELMIIGSLVAMGQAPIAALSTSTLAAALMGHSIRKSGNQFLSTTELFANSTAAQPALGAVAHTLKYAAKGNNPVVGAVNGAFWEAGIPLIVKFESVSGYVGNTLGRAGSLMVQAGIEGVDGALAGAFINLAKLNVAIASVRTKRAGNGKLPQVVELGTVGDGFRAGALGGAVGWAIYTTVFEGLGLSKGITYVVRSILPTSVSDIGLVGVKPKDET